MLFDAGRGVELRFARAHNGAVATLDAEHAHPIGRAAELAVVPQFLDAVTVRPAALVFEGGAGVGKTTLWLEGIADARERGYRVLTCRPAETEMQLPFAAIGDLLEHVTDDALTPLPEPQRHALEVAMLRADPTGEPIERRAVGLAVLAVLRRIAADQPVIVALDDIQWVDAPSVAALQFALRRVELERVGVLGTRRTGGNRNLLRDALEPVRVVDVRPLDIDSCGHMLLEQLGLSLARPALLQLYRVSEGNPFLALEVGRALQRREIVPEPGQPFPVPQNLRELVRDRVGRIPRAAREAALVVAALALPTLERLTAAGVDEDALGEAIAAGLLEIDGEHIRFTHPLLGSIVYSETPPARRRELHARLARLTDDVEERGSHLALAAVGPDAEIASTLDEAARRARRRGAPEAAAELLEQAVTLTPDVDEQLRLRRILAAAERHFEAGTTERARDLFAQVVAEAPERELRLHAGSRLGITRVLTGDIAGADAAFREARREASEPSRVPAGVEDGLSLVCEFRGDIAGAAKHARAAIRLAELQGDRVQLAQAHARAGFYEARLGRRTAWGRVRRALALSRELDDLRVIADPAWIHGQLVAGTGDVERACAIYRELRERALERGDEGSLGVVLTGLCEYEIRAGRLAEAAAAAKEGHLSTLGTGQLAQRIFMLKGVVLVAALQGHVDEARTLAAEARELIAQTDFDPLLANMDMAMGMLELSQGDPAAAHRTLAPLNDRVPAGPVTETGWFRFLADHVEALLALGELDAARATLAKLEAREHTLLDQAWTAQAVLRCRGLIAAASGEAEGGLNALGRAAQLSARGQEPFELARNLLALGRVQRRLKRRGAARESLTRAAELFGRLGTPLWRERANEELGRIGGRAPRQSGLTPTETRVAELAAQGSTNREIAAALFLSVNTVQAYLKRVYRELGVRSRAELAHHFRAREGQ